MTIQSPSLRAVVRIGVVGCLAMGVAAFAQTPGGRAPASSYEPEMVLIHGGTFQMGSESGAAYEKPVHAVRVSDFEIGRYEITNDQFAAFIKETNYRTEGDKTGTGRIQRDGSFDYYPGYNWIQWNGPGSNLDGRGRYPVVQVSWDDGVAYTAWLSKKTGKTYRLPTEAEWEYACRGGTATEYWWGDAFDQTKLNSRERWFKGPQMAKDEKRHTLILDVASLPPNPFGLYEILGNVWEWASDYADPDYSKLTQGPSPQVNPTGPATGTTRVLRGGGWNTGAPGIRCASRFVTDPSTYHSDHVGLRVVRAVR